LFLNIVIEFYKITADWITKKEVKVFEDNFKANFNNAQGAGALFCF
jgi:hypothetical protein